MTDRSVEISLNINPEGAIKGFDDAVKKAEDTKWAAKRDGQHRHEWQQLERKRCGAGSKDGSGNSKH